MKLSKEEYEKIQSSLKLLISNLIHDVYAYQEKETYLPTYYKYPEKFFGNIEKEEVFAELQNKVPAIKSGITYYSMSKINTPVDYGGLIGLKEGKFVININDKKEFTELKDYFLENTDLNKMIASEEKFIESSLKGIASNILNRYLYITKRFKKGDIDFDVINKIILEQMKRYFDEELLFKHLYTFTISYI